MGSKSGFEMSGHHILPKSRFQEIHGLGVNTREDNIVWWPQGFHDDFHLLFTHFTLSEVGQYLRILVNSGLLWSTSELSRLFNGVMNKVVVAFPTKSMSDLSLRHVVLFENKKRQATLRRLFRDLNFDQAIYFLHVITSPGDRWTYSGLKRLKEVLLHESASYRELPRDIWIKNFAQPRPLKRVRRDLRPIPF